MRSRTAVAAFVAASVLVSRDALATPHRFEAAVDAGSITYDTAVGQWGGYSAGLAIRVDLVRHFGFGTGVRYAFGRFLAPWGALEGYGTLYANPEFGPWSPRLSLEIGISTAHQHYNTQSVASDESYFVQAPVPAAPFVGIQAAPIRFRIGRAAITAAAITLGTSIPTSDGYRLGLTFVEFGWSFR